MGDNARSGGILSRGGRLTDLDALAVFTALWREASGLNADFPGD